jgi:N-methylhydantoinase A
LPAADDTRHEYFFEGRYDRQIWEIEVCVGEHMPGATDLPALRAAFDRVHAQLYGLADTRSEVEIVSWGVRSRTAQRGGRAMPRLAASAGGESEGGRTRVVTFAGLGAKEVPVVDATRVRQTLQGPLIVETDMTTIVVPPGCRIEPTPHGLLATWQTA